MFGYHADEVTALAVSPADPVVFVPASLDGTVKLWRLRK
jgi:WD40 repeat protein